MKYIKLLLKQIHEFHIKTHTNGGVMRKFLLMFSFITVLIFVSGCKITSYSIADIESILEKYNDQTDMDISYTITTKTPYANNTDTIRMITKVVDGEQQIYVEMSNNLKMYYLDGYLCTYNNLFYDVSEGSDFDELFAADLNFDELKYKLTRKKTDDNTVYTIKINDTKLKEFVEEFIDNNIDGFDIEMIMKITVDNETEELKYQELDIILTKDNSTVTVNIMVLINAIGDDVVLDIPIIVRQKINQYIESNPVIEPDPEPLVPEPVVYEDTEDGVVKYFDLGRYNQVLYDQKTNKIIVSRDKWVQVYNADTLDLEKTLGANFRPNRIDVDDGKLIVSYKSSFQYDIYNLEDYEVLSYQADKQINEIVIDGDVVIYTSNHDLVFYYLPNNEIMAKYSVYRGLITINRDEKILYVTETDSSSSDMIYYYTQTGEQIFKSDVYKYSYNKNRLIFDGKYVHHRRGTYNRFNGLATSSTHLNYFYNSHPQLYPHFTIYKTERFSFVNGVSYQNKTGIYDYNKDEFVYVFTLINGLVSHMNNGKYLALCAENEYIAIVDLGLIDQELIEKDKVYTPEGTIISSEDGKSQTLKTAVYTKTIADEKYVYTINEFNFELNVYDIQTLEMVYSEKFLLKPSSLDVDNGLLVITFGRANQFRIYDNLTWESYIVTTKDPVENAIVVNKQIFYADWSSFSKVWIYDTENETHTNLGYSGNSISMAINREDQIIYFGERSSSISRLRFYDLEKEEFTFTLSVLYSRSDVEFDGNFIHYDLNVYDKQGMKISETNMARIYPNTNELLFKQTIFDDNSISVFTAFKDDDYICVVYDLLGEEILYTYQGRVTDFYKHGNVLVFLNDASGSITTINLD